MTKTQCDICKEHFVPQDCRHIVLKAETEHSSDRREFDACMGCLRRGDFVSLIGRGPDASVSMILDHLRGSIQIACTRKDGPR